MGAIKRQMTDEEDTDDTCCPACHGAKCCGAGPVMAKELADARAERIALETMLVDAMAALRFYADVEHWKYGGGETEATPHEADVDRGTRARVTLRRILDAGARFARIAEAGE